MTGTTTPDGIRFPNDVNQPADSPNAFQMLAGDVQAALNNHMDVTLTPGSYALAAGWVADGTVFGSPGAWKTGRICVSKGVAVRTGTDLAVVDNTPITLGTVPAGWRPAQGLRAHAAWYGTASGGANVSVALLTVGTDGTLSLTPNYTGSIKVGQWVGFAGISWVTP